MMRKFLYYSVILIIALLIESCATVINTTTQNIEIKTNPSNAKIIIDGKKFGTTPQLVNLERGSNHVIKLELEGYDTYETQITRKISIWFWGNAFNGFLPGMLIDMFTGSMYNLLPEAINVELQQLKTEPAKKR
ncbi:PEGA domain-containing protein [Rosettibacter firmus]|uniref:PEGA domain-containing protein n=1 Tax=Rosettibacter firmus TaxID=3111522 RepID=UPI00336BE98D